MLIRRLVIFASLALVAVPSFAQKKDIVEVQRDIGLLRDDFLQFKQEMNETLANLKAAVQATLDQTTATNRALAVLEKSMRDRMKEQEDSVVKPVGALSGKVDNMSDEFRFVKESVADVGVRLGKLQQQIVDLESAVKIASAPPQPPAGGPGTATPPPNVSASSLWDDAMRDKSSGKYDLALGEYNDYLRWFGSTDMAPSAQFYIGEIYYSQGKLDEAVKAFDSVLEKYPDNTRTLDARLLKGKALVKLGQRNEGAKEFREIISKSKGSEQAAKAASELKALGLPIGTSRPAPRSRK